MRQFHEQLQDLLKTVVSMGNLAESMIETAVRTFVSRDQCQCDRVFELEDEVNRLQVQVDDKAVKLTVLQQPVARDARFLFMASRIGGGLDRTPGPAITTCPNSQHAPAESPLPPLAAK